MRPERQLEVSDALFRLTRDPGGSVIARGGGLAYGDAALNASGQIVAMNRLDRFLKLNSVVRTNQLRSRR